MAETYSYSQLIELISKDIRRISDFHDIPNDLITLKPDPSTWSARETIQHIIQFNNLYLNQIDKAVENNEPIKTERERFKARFIYRQFIKFLEPPYKVKVKTFAPMYPENSTDGNPKKPVDNLNSMNRNLINRVERFQNDRLDLDRIKGKNPILQWVPMSLSEFILVLEAHQRRHFWQIEQTLLKLSGKKY